MKAKHQFSAKDFFHGAAIDLTKAEEIDKTNTKIYSSKACNPEVVETFSITRVILSILYQSEVLRIPTTLLRVITNEVTEAIIARTKIVTFSNSRCAAYVKPFMFQDLVYFIPSGARSMRSYFRLHTYVGKQLRFYIASGTSKQQF